MHAQVKQESYVSSTSTSGVPVLRVAEEPEALAGIATTTATLSSTGGGMNLIRRVVSETDDVVPMAIIDHDHPMAMAFEDPTSSPPPPLLPSLFPSSSPNLRLVEGEQENGKGFTLNPTAAYPDLDPLFELTLTASASALASGQQQQHAVLEGVPLAIHRSRDDNEQDASSSSLSEDEDMMHDGDGDDDGNDNVHVDIHMNAQPNDYNNINSSNNNNNITQSPKKIGGLEAVLSKAAAAAGAVAAAAQDAIQGVGLLQTPPQHARPTIGGGGGLAARDHNKLSPDSISSESMERTGSQNSSRDWGWFEDVHQSLHDGGMMASSSAAGPGGGGGGASGNLPAGGTGTNTSSNRHKKKRPLVPQVSSGAEMHDYAKAENTDASAMAVTAPNYVLEESLSSQRLWKQTAGQRPPQPADERAFYEKMWAQNFFRSKVQYGMPVEVLTASSPISLNPFFDACFSSSATDMVDYTSAAAANSGISGGGGTANLKHNTEAVTAVAEAALQSRMNNLMPAHRDPNHRHHDVGQQQQHQVVVGAGQPSCDNGNSNNITSNNNSTNEDNPHDSTTNYNSTCNAASADAATPNTFVVNRRVQHADGDLIVLLKGDNVFGTTVSKSFARGPSTLGPIVGVDTVNISIASFRVVEQHRSKSNNNIKNINLKKSNNNNNMNINSSSSSLGSNSSGGAVGKYAQFLVIYREGAIRDTVGVWKRYSDFEELARKVTQAHEGCAAVMANMSPLAVTEEPETEHLPNAITSWRLLKKRQRWYRCLDAGYLSLKVFLLERFLHDILFESSSPKLLRDFVGAEAIYSS